MNNFEKRKFLDYLEKLLPLTDTNSYSFDTVFDFIVGEFKIDTKQLSCIDKDGDLQLESVKQREIFAKEFKKIIKKLKEKYQPQNTRLEQQFLIVKDIFSLTDTEYEIMLYLSFKEINNIFNKFLSVWKMAPLLHLPDAIWA